MSAVKGLAREAHEIVNHITQAARNGEITWRQRDELMALVRTDVSDKLKLAAGLLYDWTGNYKPERN